ncbi:MAG: HEAT repeat domain-containing protein [Spirochaetia bacterium]|nr:HEAT repeat domain-containing protein [Spirochaetia bacterium]
MRRVLVLFLFLLPCITFADDDKVAALLDKSGQDRRVGIWYIYQEKRPDLLKRAAEILLTSEDIQDQQAVIEVFDAYGENLESALPEWYVYIDRFLKFGRDEDMLVRAMALGAKWKESRLMEALSRMAAHPMRKVRTSAFRSMAAMRNDQIIPVILKLSQSGRAIERMYALEGMREYGDPRLAPFAERLLQDSNRSVKMYAIPGYATQPGSEGNSYLIARMYNQESDEELRERVIQIIVARRWGQHAGLVSQACSDSSPLVRMAAFQGARVFGLAQSVSRQLENESDPNLRRYGLDTLLFLGNSGGGTGITHILASDEDVTMRLRAATALNLFRERMGLSSLHYSMRLDPIENIRVECADALGEIGDLSSAAILLQSMGDDGESYAVKSAALLSYLRLPLTDKRSGLLTLADRIRDQRFARQIRLRFR